MPDPRSREERDAQSAREELACEYAYLTKMKPFDPVIDELVTELRVKLAARLAAEEV